MTERSAGRLPRAEGTGLLAAAVGYNGVATMAMGARPPQARKPEGPP